MRSVHLRDIATAVRGVTFAASDAQASPFPGSVPCLTTAAVKSTVDWKSARHIPEVAVRDPAVLVRAGDILVTTTNSREKVGGSVLIRDIPIPSTFGAFVSVVRSLGEVDPEFLALWMRSPDYFDAIRPAIRQTTGFANLATSALLDISLLLPALDEQRRIAARLTAQLAAVDHARVAAAAQCHEVASLRAQAYELGYRSLVPFSARATTSPAPSGWGWSLLTDLARLESGHTPSRNHPEWWGGEIPWLALPDIRAVDGQVVHDTTEYTNPDGIANSAARVLPEGTVALSRTASVGFVTIFGRPMSTSQDFVNWVCGPDLDPRFLMHLLIRSRHAIRTLSSGAVHKTVYYPTVKAFRICAPPLAEQQRIVMELESRLEAIDSVRSGVDAEAEVVKALPSALLRRAFQELLSAPDRA